MILLLIKIVFQLGKKKAPPEDDDLETKLAGMDPEKVARVRAAIAAKAKKEAAEAGKEGE